MDEEEFLKVKEIAAHLQVSKMTVYRLIRAKELDAIQVGRDFRVKQSSYKDFLAKGGAGWAP
jgi:excisionase family DNA binding protein